MKKEFKTQLLAALNSGEYKQGLYRLVGLDKDGEYHYCCLGVMGRLCGLTNEELDEQIYNEDKVHTDDCGTFLSKAISDTIGLSYDEQKRLAEINDDDTSGEFTAVIAYIQDNIEETE